MFNKNDFFDYGYTIIENFLSKEEIKNIIQSAKTLINHFQIPASPTIFNSKNAKQHHEDSYFYESYNKIHFFFEDTNESPFNKHQHINKIAHGLHIGNALFKELSLNQTIIDYLKALGQKQPFPISSMYIFKQPKIGGSVEIHQDGTFIYTTPTPVIGAWIALEEATTKNSCLYVLKEGHKQGLKSRFYEVAPHKYTFEVFDKTPWDKTRFTPLEVTAGTVILFHGHLPHFSPANDSDISRQALSFHYIDRTNKYAPDNWMKLS